MQPCDRGRHGRECDVSFLDINHHCYSVALQDSRENFFSSIMVGDQHALAIVHKAPGLRVVSEGADGLASVFDALVGHGDVPVALSLHLPDVGTSGKALGREDLRGFSEALVTAGIAYLGFHSLCGAEVIGDSEEITGCVQVQHESSCETNRFTSPHNFDATSV